MLNDVMCVCVCMVTCVCIFVCMYVCMHACMDVCMFVCMYVCMDVPKKCAKHTRGLIVADELALKQLWEDKGAGGNNLCFKSTNVVAESSDLRNHDRTSVLIMSHASPDKNRMTLQTDSGVLEAAKYLAEQQPLLNKRQCKIREMALGLNYVPYGCLYSESLRGKLKPISLSVFDWMHYCFLVGGVMQHEANLLRDLLKKEGIGPEQMCLGCPDVNSRVGLLELLEKEFLCKHVMYLHCIRNI